MGLFVFVGYATGRQNIRELHAAVDAAIAQVRNSGEAASDPEVAVGVVAQSLQAPVGRDRGVNQDRFTQIGSHEEEASALVMPVGSFCPVSFLICASCPSD